MSGYVRTRVIFFKQKYASHAFGNIVALTVDFVNIRATCASALPTNYKFAGTPIDWREVRGEDYVLKQKYASLQKYIKIKG